LQDKTKLYQVLYVSQITQTTDLIVDLDQIQQKSFINNKKVNITGILICLEDTFVQILEGKKKEVLTLMKTISLDKRHYNLNIIQQGCINNRCWGHWNMGVLNLSIRKKLLDIGFENSELLINRINKESSIMFLLKRLSENKSLLIK